MLMPSMITLALNFYDFECARYIRIGLRMLIGLYVGRSGSKNRARRFVLMRAIYAGASVMVDLALARLYSSSRGRLSAARKPGWLA